jgi:hypothetical protein
MHLALDGVDPSIQIILVLALPGSIGLKVWLVYRLTVVKERGRTERLNAAIDGVSPDHRSEIIRACGALENGDSATNGQKPHRPLPSARTKGSVNDS